MNGKMQAVFSFLYALPAKIGAKRKKLNRHMKDHYSPVLCARIATAIIAVVACLILFVPPYLGVANDGTVQTTLREAGLQLLSGDSETGWNDCFVRVYGLANAEAGTASPHILLIQLAKGIDRLFTRDSLFDVRFLALLYLLLFLPAVYLIIRAALERVHAFSETIVVAVFGVLIFSDSSYLLYFNSLYPEPLLYIGLLYIVGSLMALQKERPNQVLYLALALLWGVVLCMTRQHCFMVGLVLALLFALLVRLYSSFRERSVLVLMAVISTAAMIFGAYRAPDAFTVTSKFHAMTRGVLLEASNPAETLEEFGINTSYELLTDVSLYDAYPVTFEENPLLTNGFLDKYTSTDLILYYLKHPQSVLKLLDIGIKSSFTLRRSACGNYESSVGMPARAQTTFWSIYSIYKMRSAPKTIGYLVLLTAAIIVMSGRKMYRGKITPERFHYVYLSVLMAVAGIGVMNMLYVIVRSGDAQLSQYNMVLGVCMDLLSYYVLSEILYKLNILERKNEEKE